MLLSLSFTEIFDLLPAKRLAYKILHMWKKHVAKPSVQYRMDQARVQLQAEIQDASSRFEDGLISQEDFQSIKLLLRDRKFHDAERESVKAIRQHAQHKREHEAARKAERHHARVQKVLDDPETDVLALKFGWDESRKREYVDLRLRLDETVGLQSVKEWIVQRLYDSAERAICEDAIDRRHLLLVGGFGVGKRTASLLLVQAMKLLWDMSGVKKPDASGVHMGKPGKIKKGDKVTLTPKTVESKKVGLCMLHVYERLTSIQVMLTSDYAKYGDAKGGPLEPGDVGDVVRNN